MKSKKATKKQTGSSRPVSSKSSKTEDASKKLISPLEFAYNYIDSILTSPHESFANILSTQAKSFVKLHHTLLEKQQQVERMNDDPDLIPRSAKVQFNLKVSKATSKSTEFLALNEETSAIVTEFQKKLRDSIFKATELEVATIRNSLQKHFCMAIKIICDAYIHGSGGDNKTEEFSHSTVSAIFNLYHSELLEFTDMADQSRRG